MYDRDELGSEVGLNIMSNVLNGRGDGVVCGKWGVYGHSEVLDLEVNLI